MIDRIGDQLDIQFCECPEPSIVEQDALAIGWIGRHAFFDQVGPIVQFRQNKIG